MFGTGKDSTGKPKTWQAESFSETKGLSSPMLARKEKTKSWGMQCEPPAAGLGGRGKRVLHTGVDGLLHDNSLVKKDVSCFTLAIGIEGRRKCCRVSSGMGEESVSKKWLLLWISNGQQSGKFFCK